LRSYLDIFPKNLKLGKVGGEGKRGKLELDTRLHRRATALIVSLNLGFGSLLLFEIDIKRFNVSGSSKWGGRREEGINKTIRKRPYSTLSGCHNSVIASRDIFFAR
jgi:hypothetical protein